MNVTKKNGPKVGEYQNRLNVVLVGLGLCDSLKFLVGPQ